eukprot:NODE_287_length_10726_cov_0.240614.p4 type:complete len:165 gc:universal NODE_287_length_10726_cov_0.240614:1698-1204(-)
MGTFFKFKNLDKSWLCGNLSNFSTNVLKFPFKYWGGIESIWFATNSSSNGNVLAFFNLSKTCMNEKYEADKETTLYSRSSSNSKTVASNSKLFSNIIKRVGSNDFRPKFSTTTPNLSNLSFFKMATTVSFLNSFSFLESSQYFEMTFCFLEIISLELLFLIFFS